jgi:hypothetical protein
MTLVLLVSLLILGLPVAGHAQSPRFVGRAGASHLWLPQAMQVALHALDSAFVPYRESQYWPELLREYPPDPHARPYAVIADFNGDGRSDVVIDGQSPTRIARIVLLSTASEYQGLFLEDRARDTSGSSSSNGTGQRTVYLSYVAPLRIDSSPELEDTALVLQHEAFEVGYWEQASVLYYWDGRGFAKYTTSD